MGAVLGALLLLTSLAFVSGLSDEFAWDDHGLIRTNENIQQPARYREALTTHFWNVSKDAVETNENYDQVYRPLVTLAYIVQFKLFGHQARGYRVVSLVLHLLCTALAFLWLARRLPRGPPGMRLLAIALGTAVFALHPSRPEVVSWISGSTELWMCALVLLAAWAFDANRAWAAGVLLAMALFAKETAIVAAPLLLADRFVCHSRRPTGAEVVALGAPVALALALRLAVVPIRLSGQGAGIVDAASRALASVGLYATQVLSPWNPTAFPGMRIYSCDSGESLAGAWLIAGSLFVVVLAAVAFAAVRRVAWRPALGDLLWFLLPLLPVANLFDLGSRNLTADRFLYLPMLGVASLGARGLLLLSARRPALAKVAVAAMAVVVLGFAVVTSLHARVFASSSSFWEYEVGRNPDNPFALHAVGTARVRAGLHQSGLAVLTRALALADRTCVRADKLRAAKDLGQGLALSLAPDEVAALTTLRAAYLGVPGSGVFEHDAPPRWSVELTADEARALLADELQYALPLATLEARLGNLEAATAVIEAAESRAPVGGQLESVRLRLLAVTEGPGAALSDATLREAADGDGPRIEGSVADSHGLRAVLGVLQEALEEEPLPPEVRATVTRHALGFGPPPSDFPQLSDRSRTLVDALRAYGSYSPVDLESLRARAAASAEARRFLELAEARAALLRLDAQLQ